MPHLPNFFLCGGGEEEVGKVGKEENSTVKSRRFNESVDFGFLGGRRFFGHVVRLVGSWFLDQRLISGPGTESTES